MFFRTYFRMFGRLEFLVLGALLASFINISIQQDENDRVRDFLEGPNGYNQRGEMLSNMYSIISWAYYTNITNYNQEKMVRPQDKIFRSYLHSIFSMQITRHC